MTAVAVWDHQPSARELLEARVARGWAPTPTGTRDGPRVLGYAACMIDARDEGARPSPSDDGARD